MLDPNAQPLSLEDLRRTAGAIFGDAPEPVLTYGLNVFFPTKDVPLPFGKVPACEPSEVRAPEGVTVLSLADALDRPKLETVIMERLDTGDTREPKIRAWHNMNAVNGIVILVPPNFSSDEPIRIDLELTDERRVENTLIFVGAGSKITVVEHLRSALNPSAAQPLRSSVTDIVAQPSSKVTHISLQDFADNVTDLSLKRASVLRDASVTWIECVFGGGFSQSITDTQLEEEGAAVGSKTMFFGRARQRFDLSQKVRHLASHTHSQLSTRGALMDAAKTIYRGLVRIEKGTKGATGHQKEDTLLLGEKVEIDAVPNLEIESDDVKCGHGATMSRIDRDKLFYLMSRGLDAPTAGAFLVNGFFTPIVEEMRAAGLEDRVQCIIDERIAHLRADQA